MINILVFPCASGIGQEIFNALNGHKDITIYGANSDMINPGSILYGANYIGNAPSMSRKEDCILWLNSIFIKYNIHCIFPAYDDAQLWLRSNEKELMSVKIITADSETTQICRSKKITYDRFCSLLRCPIIYPNVYSVNGKYPIFIKPECGEGSKGCHKITSFEELNNTITDEHIILEYLPGDEYTVDCFTDIHNTLCFVGARVRSLTRAGISILTESISDIDNEFHNMAEKINNNLRFIGAWFFQVKRTTTGELCLMEIAPRIAGAMFLYREQGINFPLLSIYAHMGIPTFVNTPLLSNVVGCKIYRNHFYIPKFKENPIAGFYIDLDDTLLLPKSCKANPEIVSLLYEAKLYDIPIYLITRHKCIIEDTLNNACISINIFCDIIHITDKTPKENYMTCRPAIFMDDSFSERMNTRSPDIYSFDVDAYEIVRDIIRMSHSRFRITQE